MKASTSRKKHSVAHIVTTNPQHQLVWRSMKQFISPQLLFEGRLKVKLLLIPWMHQSSLPHWMQLCLIKAFVKETKMSNLSVKKIWSMEYSKNLIITRRESKMNDGLKIYLIKSKLVRTTLLQYTLPSLFHQFPWTTRKSKIVEKSNIVERFASTIFSTIMEFDCTFTFFDLTRLTVPGPKKPMTDHNQGLCQSLLTAKCRDLLDQNSWRTVSM